MFKGIGSCGTCVSDHTASWLKITTYRKAKGSQTQQYDSRASENGDYDFIYPDDGSFAEMSAHSNRMQGALSQIQEYFNIQKYMNLYPNLQTHNTIQVQPHSWTSDTVACKMLWINRNMGGGGGEWSAWGMLQRTEMLQRTRWNTIGRRSTRERMRCRAFPLWLERRTSSLLRFVRFSYLLICTVYKS